MRLYLVLGVDMSCSVIVVGIASCLNDDVICAVVILVTTSPFCIETETFIGV